MIDFITPVYRNDDAAGAAAHNIFGEWWRAHCLPTLFQHPSSFWMHEPTATWPDGKLQRQMHAAHCPSARPRPPPTPSAVCVTGPTLRLKGGQTALITLVNNLTKPVEPAGLAVPLNGFAHAADTNLHNHGLHTSPGGKGGGRWIGGRQARGIRQHRERAAQPAPPCACLTPTRSPALPARCRRRLTGRGGHLQRPR